MSRASILNTGTTSYLEPIDGSAARRGRCSHREIADLAPEEWTPALLDARQRRLAARAVRLWRSDSA